MHAFRKFSQLLFEKSGITVHSDHKPLEKLSSAPWPLPQATCKAWCSLFSATHSLLSLHCWQPSSFTNSRKQHSDESTMNWPDAWGLKKTTHNFQVSENLLCRKSELKQAQIRPEQKALRTFIKTGWQNDKASVPGFWVSTLTCSSWNRPFAAKPSRDLLFIKL